MAPKIVVLGAGVSGLTTALLLARSGDYDITIVAKHMPGDYDIEYASPWAGANYLPVATPGTPSETYERTTWPELARLAESLPEAGVHFQDTVIYRRAKDVGTATGDWFAELLKEDAWFKDVVPNFRILPTSDLPAGIDGGTAFTSVCFNTALYLPWLTSQCLKHGAQVRRGIVSHVAEAANLHHTGQRADLLVNCTGLASLRLGGVEDAAVYPARGQIVVVRNDPQVMASVSGTDDGSDEATYIMHRAAGGGCILGGCLQKDNWESQPDPNMAVRIMKRCVELCPKLVPEGQGIEGLSIVRHSVGLRPMRKGGPRVEREVIRGVPVVHNYGHGGYGYQTSYGAAQAAGRLVRKALGVGARL
ncbi:D-amino acid oxidase [Friedmanniomyces endolithicus]|uniref:D-amino-acid oxidase n=1 Tax=Friedmanniomyces endolithicus TaxID=329885 RepID=A0AAN6KKW0_9PEZI|nr:D-amino acid oxidase [Friedmanniomyces endolithicus]KAK0297759.1 D-amino acid oxidase [Friedmanniomyces endolithicus]KAK0305723.1 D-amino acid oxidase [Friedmanniomyces endolithicus]KAK0930573.1 D-amino acid oxidase [Friedmanniomyces endolithicus]KAK0987925.1 D-amino acid oxidase [Friedmanniomyces endolithicus]